MMSQPHIARTVVVSLLALASVAGSTRAREQTVGLFTYEADASEGYTLFAPLQSTTTYLIDNQGLIVNTWESTHTPGASVYLNNNGTLLRMSNSGMGVPGSAGLVQAFDWDSNLLWSYQVPLSHHDLEQLPNGNLLIVVWEIKSLEECIQAGRYPSTIPDGELWPETIIEVHPTGPTTGEVVWEWHLWDHLVQELDPTKDNFGVVADHPELVNINFFTTQIADWIHINAVDYNAELDQILVTVPRFGEMWVIDHSTTSEEAAGHTGGDSGKGGDLIYRWGNPLAYNAGTVADWSLFFCHDGRWIDPGLPGEGNIMVFNNGLNRPEGDFSTVEEIVPPVDGNGYEHVPTTAYGPAARRGSTSPTHPRTSTPTSFRAPIVSRTATRSSARASRAGSSRSPAPVKSSGST